MNYHLWSTDDSVVANYFTSTKVLSFKNSDYAEFCRPTREHTVNENVSWQHH